MTFDPTQNRVPTCLLTADELAALKAAKHGWEYCGSAVQYKWTDMPMPNWYDGNIYRAKPAPAPTLSITVNGVTNVVAAPTSGPLDHGTWVWCADPAAVNWVSHERQWVISAAMAEAVRRGLIHRTQAAARAHAMAMVGLKAEGVL